MLFSRITSSIFCVRRPPACIEFQGAQRKCSARTSEMIRHSFLLDNVVFQDHLKHILCEKIVCLLSFQEARKPMLSTHIRRDSRLIFLHSVLFQDHLKNVLCKRIFTYMGSQCSDKMVSTHIGNDLKVIFLGNVVFQDDRTHILCKKNAFLYRFPGRSDKLFRT